MSSSQSVQHRDYKNGFKRSCVPCAAGTALLGLQSGKRTEALESSTCTKAHLQLQMWPQKAWLRPLQKTPNSCYTQLALVWHAPTAHPLAAFATAAVLGLCSGCAGPVHARPRHRVRSTCTHTHWGPQADCSAL